MYSRAKYSFALNILSLFCLRNNENVPTNLIQLNTILEKLTNEELGLLTENVFDIKRPDSFKGQTVVISNLSILIAFKKGYYSRFDSHNASTQSAKHKLALDKFREIANDTNLCQSFNLKAGEFIIFNNQKMLHSRKAFKPKFDGNDRWLLRVSGLFEKPSANFLLDKNDNHHLNTICS